MQQIWILVFLLGDCYYFFVYFLCDFLDYLTEVYFSQPLKCVAIDITPQGAQPWEYLEVSWDDLVFIGLSLTVSFPGHSQLLSSINC